MKAMFGRTKTYGTSEPDLQQFYNDIGSIPKLLSLCLHTIIPQMYGHRSLRRQPAHHRLGDVETGVDVPHVVAVLQHVKQLQQAGRLLPDRA